MLLNMKDGGIKTIHTNKNYTQGCPTCDYGSCYNTEIRIELNNYNIILKNKEMYDYGISEEFMLEMLLKNVNNIITMTESDFCRWVENYIENSKIFIEISIKNN